MRTLSSLLALLLVPAAAMAAPTRIPAATVARATALRDAALKDGTAMAILASLTTEIGPRLAGGDNDARAVAWAQAKMKALGFDKVWTEPVTYPKWVRRSESAALVAPFPQRLVVTALGGSAGTPAAGLTAEVVAFADLAALEAADAATVRGRIVYLPGRIQARRDGGDYGRGSTVRRKGPALAAAKGAAAFLLSSVGSDTNRLAHTGETDLSTGPRIPAAALSIPDAELLEATLQRGQPVRLRLALDCSLEGSYTGANVIGDIVGSVHPEQVVTLSGHLDSWDLGTGAIDDGAGVAIAMAAGHLIGADGKHPARTVRVIAFANEEAGELGGAAYAQAHKAEVANHILGSEADFGAGRIWRLQARVKPEASAAIDQIAEVLKPLGVERASGGGSGGSDISKMHELGMAGLSLTQDGTRYFDWHHTANDTLDKVVPADLAQNVAVYAAWALMAADAEGDFGSAPGAFADAAKDD